MVSGLENGAFVNPLGAVELNGVPGYGFSYTHTEDGTDMRTSVFILVKGRYQYILAAQAPHDEWDAAAPELEAAAMSFRVE
jgi:hypothetical protein